MIETSDYKAGGRRLTGRSVFLMLGAFFGVMFLANFIMASYAIKTFSGLDADDPYDTGLAYNKEIAAARTQAALGWNVELTRTADGPATQLTVVAKDKAGLPLSGLDVSMHFFYPATRKLDRVITASPIAEGVYAASAPLSYGHWDVEVDLKRNGERQFRTRNQISVE